MLVKIHSKFLKSLSLPGGDSVAEKYMNNSANSNSTGARWVFGSVLASFLSYPSSFWIVLFTRPNLSSIDAIYLPKDNSLNGPKINILGRKKRERILKPGGADFMLKHRNEANENQQSIKGNPSIGESNPYCSSSYRCLTLFLLFFTSFLLSYANTHATDWKVFKQFVASLLALLLLGWIRCLFVFCFRSFLFILFFVLFPFSDLFHIFAGLAVGHEHYTGELIHTGSSVQRICSLPNRITSQCPAALCTSIGLSKDLFFPLSNVQCRLQLQGNRVWASNEWDVHKVFVVVEVELETNNVSWNV